MSLEMTIDDDYKNDDSTHHYPGHVDEEDIEAHVVEKYSEKGKNETTIPQEIGVTIVATKQELIPHPIPNLENLNFMIWMAIWIGSLNISRLDDKELLLDPNYDQ